MDKKYKELFSKINAILDKQNKQRLRGLNDYNMVNVVRKETHEVGMHSNVIFSLLDPNGLHYQDDLFLNLFIEKVIKKAIVGCKDFGNIFSVQAEELTDNNRRIDFTIKSDKYLIGIEMKVDAGDLDKQIEDYYSQLLKEANNTSKKVYILYLTKNGKDPLPSSSGSVPVDKIKNISFKKHILTWIEACQDEVRNITNLNMALEDYKNIVRKITNKYKGNVMSINDELREEDNINYLKTALKLDDEMQEIKGKILFDFFEEVSNVLLEENNNYKDITHEIIDRKRVYSLDKCKKFFCGKAICFGVFINSSFGNNLYFHIEVVSQNLYYGIVECNLTSEGYQLEKIDENKTLYEELEYNNWNEITWYTEDNKTLKDLKVIDLHEDDVLGLLLDFGNSSLKTDILKFINIYKQ